MSEGLQVVAMFVEKDRKKDVMISLKEEEGYKGREVLKRSVIVLEKSQEHGKRIDGTD